MSDARELPINTFSSRQNSVDSALSVTSLLQPLTPLNDSHGSPIATTPTASLRSTASGQFRIKRKPVPRFHDKVGTKPVPLSSMPDKVSAEQNQERVTSPQSLGPRNMPDRNSQTEFQLDLDRLFDELFDECRAGGAIPTVRSTPANSTHRRSRSDYPESFSSSILRTQTLRRPRILSDSSAHNLAPPTSEDEPRLKAKTNPFFASGRELGPPPSSGRPPTAPGEDMVPTGRVRNAVMQIEGRIVSPDITVPYHVSLDNPADTRPCPPTVASLPRSRVSRRVSSVNDGEYLP